MKPTNSNRKIYRVRLDDAEREMLRGMVDGGGSKERRRRAHVLLPADGERPGGGYRDADSRCRRRGDDDGRACPAAVWRGGSGGGT